MSAARGAQLPGAQVRKIFHSKIIWRFSLKYLEIQLKIFQGWRPAGAAVRVPGGRGGGVPGHRVQAQLGGGHSGAPHQPARHTGHTQYQLLL